MLIDLEQENFESRYSELLKKCKLPLLSIVKSSDLKEGISSIDQMVLVGGSTRIPTTKSLVKEATEKSPPQGVNPDHSVGLGASIEDDFLTSEGAAETLLLDVASISLGTEVEAKRVMIARNSPIPTRDSETFTNAADNQPDVTIYVPQGEKELAKTNKNLDHFVLSIRPASEGMSSVKVIFDIDVDGVLIVTAKDKDTGKEKTIIVTDASNPNEKEVKPLINDFERNSGKDREILNEACTYKRFTKTFRKTKESKDLKKRPLKWRMI